jgi:chitin disaccharide deacetylase
MKKLVINADDFGMSTEVNEGIKQGIRAGVLTSVSVMANMPFFDDAVRFLKKHPKVKVGLHLNITEGKSLLWPAKASTLLREDNYFYSLPVVAVRLLTSQTSLKEVRQEMVAQFEKLKATGLPINHIDSHHHIHLFPSLFRIVWEFAQANQVKTLRCRKFSFSNLTNGIKLFPNLKQLLIICLSLYCNVRFYKARDMFSNNSIYDLNWEKTISEAKFLRILNELPDGVTGIICHPAVMSKEGNRKFLASRYHCLQLMLKPKIRQKIHSILNST